MIYLFFIFFTLVSTLIIQSIFSMYFPLFGTVPELVLISVVYFSLKEGVVFGEFYGFVAGLILDIFSLQIFGLRAFLFTFIGFSVGKYSHKLDESKIKVQVLINSIVLIACILIARFVSLIFIPYSTALNITGLFWTVIYSCIIVPFEFTILEFWVKKIKKWSGKANLI